MSKCKSVEIPLMYIPDSTEKDTEKIRFVSKMLDSLRMGALIAFGDCVMTDFHLWWSAA